MDFLRVLNALVIAELFSFITFFVYLISVVVPVSSFIRLFIISYEVATED